MQLDTVLEFETERLLMRQWKNSDREPFAIMNSDPAVMKFFPALLSREKSDASMDKLQGLIAEQGWGLWALEEKLSGQFVGFTGLNVPSVPLPFSPCVEVGWRLSPEFWGRGLATEAARQAVFVGFDQVGLAEIVSFTAVPNHPSRAVMNRLGMVEAECFNHPSLSEGHELQLHVLYKLSLSRWLRLQGAASS